MYKDKNTGSWNTGNLNKGHRNTGDCNTGDWNTGDYNTWNYNTGNWNTGGWNTGNWNTGDCNTGHCNTITPKEILIFNKLAKKDDWDNCDKPNWMYFKMTKWIEESSMSDKEKDAYPSYATTGGYLKCWDNYQSCARDSWDKTTQDDRELTLKLPNFDDSVFEEIFGFSVIESLKKKHKITIDGKDITLSEDSFNELKKQLK